MKKILIPLAVFSFGFFASCGNKENANQENAIVDSLKNVEALERQEVEQMSSLINSVSQCLDSIKMQEKMIFEEREGTTDKQKVLAQLASFKELLARKQAQINALAAQNKELNKSSKETILNLQNMIDYLSAQLEEKSQRIAELEEMVRTKDVQIDELNYNVRTLTNKTDYLEETAAQQDKELNTRYYCVGTKEQLMGKGLLKGGFLKKTKVDAGNIDKDLFQRVDFRTFNSLNLKSKSPKIMSGNAANSYELIKNADGTTTLKITDAEKFWNSSNFLIIQL